MQGRSFSIVIAMLAGLACASAGFLARGFVASSTEDRDVDSDDDFVGLHSLAEAVEVATEARQKGTAMDLAGGLALIDSWSFRPEDEPKVDEFKKALMNETRVAVVNEVHEKQQAALTTGTTREAAELQSEAGQILSLYPMTDDEEVIAEAKQLSAKQGELAARIESLRHQRYNRWAVERIEAAIREYYENQSYRHPKAENPRLIESLVKNLAEIEPGLLEPIPMELYNYVVSLTKGSIGEKDKIELTRKITDPNTKRKGLGDF